MLLRNSVRVLRFASPVASVLAMVAGFGACSRTEEPTARPAPASVVQTLSGAASGLYGLDAAPPPAVSACSAKCPR